jgi:uncharacterized membrane protein YphA (DoxX/SURF4 family)
MKENDMTVLAWILQGVLGLAFLAAGGMKLAQPRKKLIDSGMSWAEDFTDGPVKVIGALEVLGAVGLVLPTLLGVAPVLTPIAAAALALVMAGAVVTHIRRGEYSGAVPSAVLGVLALVVAILRFGPLA